MWRAWFCAVVITPKLAFVSAPVEYVIVRVVLGLPVGIWCLTRLGRREVRDEFQRVAWLAKNRDFQSSQGS